MGTIFLKELNQFFSSLVGYIAIGIFLVMSALFTFVFPATSVLDAGFASLDSFFSNAPLFFLFLVAVVVALCVYFILVPGEFARRICTSHRGASQPPLRHVRVARGEQNHRLVSRVSTAPRVQHGGLFEVDGPYPADRLTSSRHLPVVRS